jgi:DNA-directed RNA polymerase specialized sigma54-like protein
MVATPKGTFPLKSLFSVTIETENKEKEYQLGII